MIHRSARALAASAATAALVALSPAPADATPTPTPTTPAATRTAECRDLTNINNTRVAAGLKPVAGLQNDLTTYARTHARDMAAQRRLWHDMTAFRAAAPQGWTRLAENVAYNSGGIDAIHTAYLDSPGHRANILNPAHTHVGIGVTKAGGLTFNSENFATGPTTWPTLTC